MSAPLHIDADVARGSFSLSLRVDVPAGQVLGLIGPNGAGKTTALRAVAGLTPLTAGRISLGTQVWDDPSARVFVPPYDRSAPVVFQDYRLFPHLSVLDNVAYSRRAGGVRKRPARDHAARILGLLELTELAARRPHQLSGGQAQRVAVARALAADPKVLLLDEPLAALDARTRLAVRSALQRTLREQMPGPTLLVTHDPLEAMVLADRLVVIEHGRIVQQGRPAEVARRPATDYVARLVGLNLYQGVAGAQPGIVNLDGGGTLVAAGHGEDLASGPEAAPWPRAGSRLLVAVSPASITLHVREPDHSSARNLVHGHISGLEMLTDRVRVEVRGTPDALVDITPAALADLTPSVGQPVWLTVKASEVVSYPG